MAQRSQRGQNLPQRNGGARAFDYGAMVEAFAKVRARLVGIAGDRRGRDVYYEVLATFGCGHANQCKSASAARRVYCELAATAAQWEAEPPTDLAPAQRGFGFSAEPRCEPRANERRSKPLTIKERFSNSLRRQPEIYVEFLRRTREAQANANGGRCGARLIWERMRWYFRFEREGGEAYKLKDHFIAYYARLVMVREPDLRGFFEIRELRTP